MKAQAQALREITEALIAKQAEITAAQRDFDYAAERRLKAEAAEIGERRWTLMREVMTGAR